MLFFFCVFLVYLCWHPLTEIYNFLLCFFFIFRLCCCCCRRNNNLWWKIFYFASHSHHLPLKERKKSNWLHFADEFRWSEPTKYLLFRLSIVDKTMNHRQKRVFDFVSTRVFRMFLSPWNERNWNKFAFLQFIRCSSNHQQKKVWKWTSNFDFFDVREFLNTIFDEFCRFNVITASKSYFSCYVFNK